MMNTKTLRIAGLRTDIETLAFPSMKKQIFTTQDV
jgi:hypothetical protein